MLCVGLDKCLFDKCLCSNPLHWSESSKSILNYFEPIWMQSWRIFIIPLFKMIKCVDIFFWFSIVLRIILTFIYWCAKRSNTRRVPCWRLYLRESDQITLRLSGPSVSYHGSSWNITNRLVQCINLYKKRTNTEPYLSTNAHGLYNYTNFKRRILHNSTHSDWEFLGKEESTFSSKFGGRPKLEEREVTLMHFCIWKSSTIDSRWNTAKKCTF